MEYHIGESPHLTLELLKVLCVELLASNPLLSKQDRLKLSELISDVMLEEREKLYLFLQRRKKKSHVSRETSSQMRTGDIFQVDKQLCIFKCGV